MKKLNFLAILLAAFLCSCNKYEIKTAESVVNLHVGDTYQLKVDCDKRITYNTEKISVATVTSEGLVEAMRVGTTEISISNLKDEVRVKINVLRLDGQYHPTKKILKIYKVNDFGEQTLDQNWVWENNNLVRINSTHFYYDEEGWITSIDAATNFSYGENGLEKVECYMGTWIYWQAFYHYDDGVLSEIILNSNEIGTFPEDGIWSTNKLTWENGNVVRVDTQSKDGDLEDSNSIIYTYDDKANPFCGFPYPFDFTMLSANNCLSESYEYIDSQGNISNFEACRFAYSYYDDYPTFVCDTYGNQYYYEYEIIY